MTEIKISHLGGVMVEGAIIVEWMKEDGAAVRKGEKVVVVETRKITADVAAPADGTLRHLAEKGERVAIEAAVGAVEP